MKAAAVGAAITSLAGYPRLVLWNDQPHQLWFLALTLAWASFILWSFVFAWHSKFSQCPFFFPRANLRLLGIATGSGLLGALTLEWWIDPVLRRLVPDDYPATLELWFAMTLFALSSLVGMWLIRYVEVYPSEFGVPGGIPFGVWEIGTTLLYVGLWGWAYCAFMDAFPRMRVTLLTSPFRDEVQVPVDPETMEPLPAHE